VESGRSWRRRSTVLRGPRAIGRLRSLHRQHGLSGARRPGTSGCRRDSRSGCHRRADHHRAISAGADARGLRLARCNRWADRRACRDDPWRVDRKPGSEWAVRGCGFHGQPHGQRECHPFQRTISQGCASIESGHAPLGGQPGGRSARRPRHARQRTRAENTTEQPLPSRCSRCLAPHAIAHDSGLRRLRLAGYPLASCLRHLAVVVCSPQRRRAPTRERAFRSDGCHVGNG
jgi:hypothetical protein